MSPSPPMRLKIQATATNPDYPVIFPAGICRGDDGAVELKFVTRSYVCKAARSGERLGVFEVILETTLWTDLLSALLAVMRAIFSMYISVLQVNGVGVG
jgi:hypothetical protein